MYELLCVLKNAPNATYPNYWKKRESFLFEFVLAPSKNRMNTKTVISPSDPQYDSNRLSEIFMEIDGFKQPAGKKWLVNYQKLLLNLPSNQKLQN